MLTPKGLDLKAMVSRIEKQYMDVAISFTGGNETKAAELVGYSRDTFRYRRKLQQ